MKKCLICSSSIEPFIFFGSMPIANGFLTKEQFPDEYFFELSVAFCRACGMVQLLEQPDPEKMFNENYAFFSGTSRRMAVHFKEFAEHVMNDFLNGKNPFVVEIGSNDGIMLQNFAAKGMRHLGIEPSGNVATLAREKGIDTICKFFDEKVAREIVSKHGQADVILGANVMCHIPYIHSVIEGMRVLLKAEGAVIFEDPYLGDVIEKTSYDQIYDEHVFLFSVSSIGRLFNMHGMEVVDIEPQTTHGGSMRYIIANKGRRPVSAHALEQLDKEKAMGLQRHKTYETFRKNCEKSKKDLMKLLRDIHKDKKRVVGYAATSKSTTVINYCGITPDLVEFISDTTPIKQGKYSPGAHIPVRRYEDFSSKYPDYSLLFGWNHSEEIMAKEQAFMRSGGKWITYIPKVKVF